jgi:hypothetical protein
MVEERDHARFRWGWWLEGGPYFSGGSPGGIGGATVRMGAQITDMFGVTGQAVALIGGGGAISSNSTAVNVIAVGGFGVLGELTLGNIFFVGLGPEVVGGTAGSESVGPGSVSVSEYAGVMFGLTGRLGLALGSVRPGRRKGFSFGVDFHTFFTPGSVVVVPMFGLGMEAF